MYACVHTSLAHTHTTGADVNFLVPPSDEKDEEDTWKLLGSDHKICEGMTPIMMALNIDDGGCNPNPDCIRTLVRLGSDCNTQAGKGSDKEGLTAFEMLGTPDMDPEVWHENRIQVYAPHQRYRKFPHTAVIFLKCPLLSTFI